MTKAENAQVAAKIEEAYQRGKHDGGNEYAKKYLAQRAVLDHPIARRFNDLTELLITKGLKPAEAAHHASNVCGIIMSADQGISSPGKEA